MHPDNPIALSILQMRKLICSRIYLPCPQVSPYPLLRPVISLMQVRTDPGRQIKAEKGVRVFFFVPLPPKIPLSGPNLPLSPWTTFSAYLQSCSTDSHPYVDLPGPWSIWRLLAVAARLHGLGMSTFCDRWKAPSVSGTFVGCLLDHDQNNPMRFITLFVQVIV